MASLKAFNCSLLWIGNKTNAFQSLNDEVSAIRAGERVSQSATQRNTLTAVFEALSVKIRSAEPAVIVDMIFDILRSWKNPWDAKTWQDHFPEGFQLITEARTALLRLLHPLASQGRENFLRSASQDANEGTEPVDHREEFKSWLESFVNNCSSLARPNPLNGMLSLDPTAALEALQSGSGIDPSRFIDGIKNPSNHHFPPQLQPDVTALVSALQSVIARVDVHELRDLFHANAQPWERKSSGLKRGREGSEESEDLTNLNYRFASAINDIDRTGIVTVRPLELGENSTMLASHLYAYSHDNIPRL